MGILDYLPKITPDIGNLPSTLPTLPQRGFFDRIGDWASAPVGLGGDNVEATGLNRLGLLAAQLQDAGASPGQQGYVNDFMRRSAFNDQLQRKQQLNKAISAAGNDMGKVRSILTSAAANGDDISHIMQALQFGAPQDVAYAPGTTVMSKDPLTGNLTEKLKVPERATPNQPFNPDGTPNKGYQAYEEKLRTLGRDQGLGPDALFSTIDTAGGTYGVTRTGKLIPMVGADGKPLISYHSDPSLRYDLSAAQKGGAAGGANAEAWPATESNFQTIAGTLKQFQDPKIKSQAGKSIGFGSVLPTVPGQNSDFRALQAKLKGGAFLMAYQNLRGGGAITDIEGQKAEQAYLGMSNAQTPEEFYKALDAFNEVLGRAHYAARIRAQRGMAVPQLGQTPQILEPQPSPGRPPGAGQGIIPESPPANNGWTVKRR